MPFGLNRSPSRVEARAVTGSPVTRMAHPPRLAWFLLLSSAAHALLLLGPSNSRPRIEGGEQYRLLATQLIGHTETSPAHRTVNAASSAVMPAIAAKQAESVTPFASLSTAVSEPDGRDQQARDASSRARAQVIDQFTRYFHYPAIARQRGWEGRVVLGFQIGRDGRLRERHLAQTSGFAILDRAALDSLRQVERVSESGVQLNMQIPVVYRLTGEN